MTEMHEKAQNDILSVNALENYSYCRSQFSSNTQSPMKERSLCHKLKFSI